MRSNLKRLIQQLLICSIVFPVSGIPLSAAPDNSDSVLYLSIVATETEQLSALKKHPELSKKFKSLSVISSNDCTNLKPGLVLYVANKSHNKADAKQHLINAKAIVPDSYLRECHIKPHSLLSNDFTFIDNSIFALPEETISWSFDDVKSEIITLNENISFLIVKKFNGNINDEVEGRQSALYYIEPESRKPQLILNQCWDFALPSQKNKLLAFQCMTGMAANHYINTVYVYNLTKNNILFEREYCQKASINNQQLIGCLEEKVDANGELTLSPQTFEIQ